MDRLWSPWRYTHVTRDEKEKDVSFLLRIGQENRDEENLVIFRGKTVFVLLNLYPYNSGHVMIAPFREVAHYVDLTWEERHELADVLCWCQNWIQTVYRPDGFNIGLNIGSAGGAGFPKHLHMHVVPRWNSDTNFLPVTADTKVLPETLPETYEKLVAAVRAWQSKQD